MRTIRNGIQKNIFAIARTVLMSASLVSAAALANAQELAQTSSDAASFSEGYTHSAKDWNAQTRSVQANKSSGFHHITQNRPQVWISDIGTLLFDDLDGDGYHSGFSVSIDVDSEFGDTEVYAKIYIESTQPDVFQCTEQPSEMNIVWTQNCAIILKPTTTILQSTYTMPGPTNYSTLQMSAASTT